MKKDGNLYIHIGLHKTGTTFLQQEVFPKLKNVNYISKYNRQGSLHLITTKFSKDKINLFSEEHLTRQNYLDDGQASMSEIAKRIHKLFPEAKIILTLRNKDDWLKSLYNQYARTRGLKSFEEWYNDVFDKEDLNFEKFVKLLNDLFDDVLVLEYELLKKDSDLFVKKICNFMNVDVPKFNNIFVYKSPALKDVEKIRKKGKTLIGLIRFFSSKEHGFIESIFIQFIKWINR